MSVTGNGPDVVAARGAMWDAPRPMPCTHDSPSCNGALVVLAENYDRLRDAITEAQHG